MLHHFNGPARADLNREGLNYVTSPLLEAVALACERDWRLLFENLELRLSPCDMLQISGPNGSGKTSLLRLLAGLMQPTAGEIRLNGQALNGQRAALASHLLWIGHAAGSRICSPPKKISVGFVLCIAPRAAKRFGLHWPPLA